MAVSHNREALLFDFSGQCEDAAAGLYRLKSDLLQSATEITSIVSELFAISAALKEIQNGQPGQGPRRWGASFFQVDSDLALVFRSLNFTLEDIFAMFARTRTRSPRTAWEELNYRTEHQERTGLLERVQMYRDFLDIQCEILAAGNDDSPARRRSSIADLLARQGMIRGLPSNLSMSISGPSRTRHASAARRRPSRSRTRSRSRSRRRLTHVHSGADYEGDRDFLADDADFRPPAPEAPLHSPAETFSSSESSVTRSGHTSHASGGLTYHWAMDIFNGLTPTTGNQAEHQHMDRCTCYGQEEPGALENLSERGYERVCKVALDEQQFCALLFWRPADFSARILLLVQDAHGRTHKYCTPLKSLSLIRDRSCVLLCHVRRGSAELQRWALLNFYTNERLVLFSCTFLAAKHQDPAPLTHPHLVDGLALQTQGGGWGEECLFAGQIQHGAMMHALRLLRDLGSGVVRIEASPCRGDKRDVPIWTAFVTRYIWDAAHMHYEGNAVVSIAALRNPPSVFVGNYEPPKGREGMYILPFTSDEDASMFIDAWTTLCRRRGQD